MDFILSLIALIVLSPVLLVVAILVRIKLGSPVIFKQQRPGLNEKIFTLYKFKSMANAKDKNGNELSDKERLKVLANTAGRAEKDMSDENRMTGFGRMLRALSLDELPELCNILKGDMSFFGPRPLSVIYLPYYNETEKLRHTVMPGLTGLAQVNGRNAISWEKRFEYDIEYIKKISFREDLYILLKTFSVVFSHKDIAQAEEKPVAFHVIRQQELDATNVAKRK
jgi:lipopolysaccharide/colanic/teichoic acid biosynthesis glycosyltransferase